MPVVSVRGDQLRVTDPVEIGERGRREVISSTMSSAVSGMASSKRRARQDPTNVEVYETRPREHVRLAYTYFLRAHPVLGSDSAVGLCYRIAESRKEV